MTITADRILTIYSWFQISYYHITSRRINFPTNTDPCKTYQFRWIESFARKIDEWKLTDIEAKYLIEEVIKYSKERKLLSRGVGVLCKADILEECYKRLNRKHDRIAVLISEIKANHEFLAKNSDGLQSNLIHWFQQGRLCVEFVALSKSCLAVLNKLDAGRGCIPTLRELFLIRMRCLHDAREQLRAILKGDLKDEN